MRKWIVIGIIILGFFIRLVALNKFPSGFTPDEASFGYDAYSIIHTGRDQWGQILPITLKSFGDFKSPVYTYAAIPFVAILGLTKEAVRLPNVVFGTAAILVVYLLVKKVLDEKTALFAALLLAISPWHVMMGRGAFEANLTTFFLSLGVYLLISKKFSWAAIVLGLNLFTYHSAKVVTPIVLLFYVVLFRNELLRIEKRKFFLPIVVFAAFLAVTVFTLLNGAGTRAKDLSIFSGSLEEAFTMREAAISVGENRYLAKIVNNKYTVDVKRFIGNYVTYFSPSYLFTHGPAEFTYGMLPGTGVLYWFELPLLFFFLVAFVKSKDRRFYYLILGWILVAPIPAALATGPGYAGNRSVIMIPAIQIALAVGLTEALKYFKNQYVWAGYFVFAVFCFFVFLNSYFIVSPAIASKDMLYGNLEAATWLSQNIDKNTQVVVDKSLSEPHIYIAFASRWNPTEYQMATKNWNFTGEGLTWVDQMPIYSLGNYTFKTVHTKEYEKISGVILVGKPDEFPSGANIIKTIYYPDGTPAILIVKT